MSVQNSPVVQFRSNVQWFLEGNTPQHQTEMVVELLAQLTILAEHIKENPEAEAEDIKNFLSFFRTMTRRELQDTAKLKDVVQHLKKLSKNPAISQNRSLRNAIVQLIVIAEGHADLPFRKSVLDLARSL